MYYYTKIDNEKTYQLKMLEVRSQEKLKHLDQELNDFLFLK